MPFSEHNSVQEQENTVEDQQQTGESSDELGEITPSHNSFTSTGMRTLYKAHLNLYLHTVNFDHIYSSLFGPDNR